MKYREYLDNKEWKPMATWKQEARLDAMLPKQEPKKVSRPVKRKHEIDEADLINAAALGIAFMTCIFAVVVKLFV